MPRQQADTRQNARAQKKTSPNAAQNGCSSQLQSTPDEPETIRTGSRMVRPAKCTRRQREIDKIGIAATNPEWLKNL
ncbi:hypothetical protein [Allosphingosinicella vermicomposti]|uniref:hypothetical protein n=1 Tax=Allosphingosinicella vermicomposti TaxID=614671 RepID=UPI00131A5F81|nr:hypothetical protein [Allosphingosinicella vermicomposti]